MCGDELKEAIIKEIEDILLIINDRSVGSNKRKKEHPELGLKEAIKSVIDLCNSRASLTVNNAVATEIDILPLLIEN